jgi:hypothetical protein
MKINEGKLVTWGWILTVLGIVGVGYKIVEFANQQTIKYRPYLIG